MGLNPRGRGRGRGGKGGNFPPKGQRGGRMGGQGPMFRGGPPGMFCPPPMGFPPEPPFGGGPFFPGPSAFNFGPIRPGFGKFPRKNFKRRAPQKNNQETPVPEIDLTKPWVTDEIKTEDGKKQEVLETWRKSKNDDDWAKYKAQKEVVKNLYEKAKEEYLASHKEEAAYLLSQLTTTTSGRRYYCETCDKAFKTDDDLIWHEGEHETCDRDGCQFTAHPKVIAKHVKMQHETGLFKRIGKLYTQEDIVKWIEERKRKYPSRKVIEEKKAMEEEKIKRGERIMEDKSRFNKAAQNRGKNESGTLERTRKNRRARQRRKKKGKIVESALAEEEIANSRSVPAFSGICCNNDTTEVTTTGKADPDLGISDDEWEYKDPRPVFVEPLVNKSLGLLASAYDSDGSEEGEIVDDREDGEIIQKENRLADEPNDGEKADDAPEEVKTITSKGSNLEPVDNKPVESHRKRKAKPTNQKDSIKRNRHDVTNGKNFETRKMTLLEKLLRNEIRHERNVILQCVHYVVKNKFFGIT